MEAKYQVITLGESICDRMKTIYFKYVNWSDCHQDVAKKFSELKKIMRKFYAGQTDEEILSKLITYSNQDIIDAF